MKTRSTLTGSKHTAAEYDAAKLEPVDPQPAGLGRLEGTPVRVAGPPRSWPRSCARTRRPTAPQVDTGGYKVITTLDFGMQKIAEKWVYVAARAPNAQDPSAILASTQDRRARTGPGSSACAATTSTTRRRRSSTIGRATSSPTSARASYTSKGNEKFQPQFDVLADGWRQPGSAIKPIDYAIGIDDEHAHRRDDAHGRDDELRQNYVPIQADKLERGPVRLRSALQFSLNVPAIKATIMTGLDHTFERTKDFGLTYQSTASPVALDGHRDPRAPPDRPARRIRHHRQRRGPDAPQVHQHDPR